MQEMIDIPTGMVAVTTEKAVLNVHAIGSCVVVSAYSPQQRIGGLAHIMLPGEAPERNSPDSTKYAANALDEMLSRMSDLGADMNHIEICMAGGANVLKDPDGNIGKSNVDSIMNLTAKKRLNVRAQVVGGTKRRSVSFDTGKGVIFYTEGNRDKGVLWAWPAPSVLQKSSAPSFETLAEILEKCI